MPRPGRLLSPYRGYLALVAQTVALLRNRPARTPTPPILG